MNGSCENTNVTLSHLFIDLKALYVNHKSLQKTEKWDGNDGGKYWIKFIVLLQDYLTRVDALVVKLPPSFNILADDFNLLIIWLYKSLHSSAPLAMYNARWHLSIPDNPYIYIALSISILPLWCTLADAVCEQDSVMQCFSNFLSPSHSKGQANLVAHLYS